jgi:hypothetical protein
MLENSRKSNDGPVKYVAGPVAVHNRAGVIIASQDGISDLFCKKTSPLCTAQKEDGRPRLCFNMA